MAPKRKGDDASEARPEKKHKNRDLTVPLVSAVINEEPAFLRGGASILTPLERKQIHIQAKQDVLFEQGTGKKPSQVDDSSDPEGDSEGDDVVRIRQRGSKKSTKSGTDSKAKRIPIGQEEGPRIEGLDFKVGSPSSTKTDGESVWYLDLWFLVRYPESVNTMSPSLYRIISSVTYH